MCLCLFFEELKLHGLLLEALKKRVSSGSRASARNPENQMEKEPSRREQKRESARKARERAIYTKKAVRIKEARAEKRKQQCPSSFGTHS